MSILLILFSMVEPIGLADPNKQEADLEVERTRVLRYIEEPPSPQLRMTNTDTRTNRGKFARQFEISIWPFVSKSWDLAQRWETLLVAIDRALYRTLEERKQWQTKMLEFRAEREALFSSSEYRNAVQNWAGFAEKHKLDGALVLMARKLK